MGNRLFLEVRDDNGLAYATGASLGFYRQTYGTLWLSSVAPREALTIARRIIAELKAAGPSAVELEAARAQARTEILADADTPDGLAWQLADWEFTYGTRLGVDSLLLAFDAVTVEDVTAALNTYLQNVRTVAAVPGDALSESDLRSLFSPQ